MDKNIFDLLMAAVSRREPMRSRTDALRLVNGFGDGMEGLFLEQYGHNCVAQVFDGRWLKEFEALTEFVKERLSAQYFIIKDRTRSPSSEPEAIKTYVCLQDTASQATVCENGLKFTVDLNDTLNVGLFLDMRRNRQLVSALAKDKRVLNCFAYTCSFGVYCRHAGALGVTNVDISKKNLARGRVNYELNGLSSAPNEFIRSDAVEYLERAVKKDNRFDLIILDPPSFARHEGRTFSVKQDLAPLVDTAIKVLNPGGALFVATNYSVMTASDLEEMAHAALGERPVRRIEHLTQDEDFPGSGTMQESYLAAVLVETC
jgi:23S rRNA (cytosine1962-C5)-methyltransferase